MKKLVNKGWLYLLVIVVMLLAYFGYHIVETSERDHFSSVSWKEKCVILYLESFRDMYIIENEVPPTKPELFSYVVESGELLFENCRIDVSQSIGNVKPGARRLNLNSESCNDGANFCFSD